MMANILHTKGITKKQEFLNILKQIKVLEIFQLQINSASDVKSIIIYKTIKL
jgi:hypothetical protein